jgi:sialate O-acetylesterase
MTKFSFIIILALLPLFSKGQNTKGNLQLPSLIADNMLLQQKTKVKIWGTTTPGQNVNVEASWKTKAAAIADKSGKWEVSIPTPEAGGPYTITVSDNANSIIIKNVLIGEVWFCSGQSNMEMPLMGWPPNDTIEHSKTAIDSANIPEIRLFNVQHAMSFEPAENCVGQWEICNSASAANFSAVAYFFGKKLHDKLHIPIGLIESAWGGTPIESWISGESLKNMDEFKSTLAELKSAGPRWKKYMAWLKSHPQVEVKPGGDKNKWRNLDLQDDQCSSQYLEDKDWPVMKLPQNWEQTDVGDFDGVVWFRKSIGISSDMVGKELKLSLGPIDDMDRTYFNGVLVGTTEETGLWQADRNYTIPAKIVKAGMNTITVRVVDIVGGGGIWGKPDKMKLSVRNDTTKYLPLAGDWKYLPVAELNENTLYIFSYKTKEFLTRPKVKAMGPYVPTILYNGMVNPVLPYQIKGAIWYQGEANVGRAEQYSKLMPTMIQNWRKAWGIENFPFYYVQIAPYEYSYKDSTNSAEIREAQAMTMKVINTGMAVTLDIGKVYNIHPPFKIQVGDRLACWALAKNYGFNIPFSGPMYKSMQIEGSNIRLWFFFAEGGLVAKNGELKEFEIAGKDGKYVPAKAKIVGNEVVVSSPTITEPVSVRYCWHNGSEASLFNGAGLPASVFKTK